MRSIFFILSMSAAAGGLPVLEIGFPSKDPYEDGEVIKKAHETVGDRALPCHGFLEAS